MHNPREIFESLGAQRQLKSRRHGQSESNWANENVDLSRGLSENHTNGGSMSHGERRGSTTGSEILKKKKETAAADRRFKYALQPRGFNRAGRLSSVLALSFLRTLRVEFGG